MSVKVYPVGRNFDGTGYSPLFFNENSSEKLYRFLTPVGNTIKSLDLATTSTATVNFCSGGSSAIYKINGLFVVVDPEDGRLFLTSSPSSLPDKYLYSQAYLGASSGTPVVLMSNVSTNITITTNGIYQTTTAAVEGQIYTAVKLGVTPGCTSLAYIGGSPVISNGIVYLTPPENVASFFTQTVSHLSFYFVVTASDFTGLAADIKTMVIAGPAGQTVEQYISFLLGIVPNSTTAVSTTPSPPGTGSSTGLTPEQAIAVKKRAHTYSVLIMVGLFILVAIGMLITIIVFLATRPKKFPYDRPLKYDQSRKVVYDA